MTILKERIINALRDESSLLVTENPWPRMVPCPHIPGKATTLVGVRRAGKSTLMRATARRMAEESGSKPEEILAINFSDERLVDLTTTDLSLIIETHYQLHPRLRRQDGILALFDEIQLIDRWELFIDRLVRNKRNRIFLSGSSAKLLSVEIATELRGRSLTQEVFPLSLIEYFHLKDVPYELPGEVERGKTAHHTGAYLNYGGFPELIMLEPPMQRRIIQEYLDILYLRDIIDRYNPRNPHAVKRTIQLALGSVAAPATFTKLSKRLKAAGISVSVAEVSEYLSWAQDCYLLFLVPIFSQSIHQQQTNPRKLYCVDNGIVNIANSGISSQQGARLENAVFLALRRTTPNIYYYRTEDGREVDFVQLDVNGEINLFQVSVTLESEATRERELAAIVLACKECNLSRGIVVTWDQRESLMLEGIEVEVLSFADFSAWIEKKY